MMRTLVRGTTTAVAIGALALLSWTGVGRAATPSPLERRTVAEGPTTQVLAAPPVTAPAAPATSAAPATPAPAAPDAPAPSADTPSADSAAQAPPAAQAPAVTVVSCGTGVGGTFEVIADEADCPASAPLRVELAPVAG